MNICIVGSGYVGLVAGTCLADFGMNVTCVDNDKNKIEALNKGEVPIYELGLNDMIQRNLKLERLHFTTDLEEAVKRSLVIFLAVGTPQDEFGKADLSQIFDVCEKIAGYISEYKVLICKSTVPVGTAAALEKLIKKKQKNNIEFDIISNPEFLREGSAVNDFLQPDRVVVGCKSERARAIIHDIYRSLYITDTPFIDCSNETAELIKYAANTMLALKISYINEIANLCELIGADINQVGIAVGLDSRIGPHFLHPGPGFGGSCLPKDVSAINEVALKNNFEFKLAQAVLEINKRQQDIVVKKSKTILGNLKDKKICLLGLAFKPNTDDVRDAPAIYIAQQLLKQGAIINTYDPVAMDEAKKVLPDLNYFDDPYSACKESNLIIVITDWNEFQHLDFEKIKDLVKEKNIMDTRNIYNPTLLKSAGFKYFGTGR